MAPAAPKMIACHPAAKPLQRPRERFGVAKSIISRPLIFAAALAAAAIAFGAAGWALFMAGSTGPAAGPLVIASDRAALPDALADAPFVSAPFAAANGRSDVWIVLTPDCPACEKVQEGLAAKLVNQGVAVRVLVAAPRDAKLDAGVAARVAAIAMRRDWSFLLACYPQPQAACDPGSVEPEAVDGYLEWGRASIDRLAPILAANDAKPAYPMAFWRAGKEWRAAVGDEAAAWAGLETDLSR